jgi:hypothetical protein
MQAANISLNEFSPLTSKTEPAMKATTGESSPSNSAKIIRKTMGSVTEFIQVSYTFWNKSATQGLL